MGYVFKNENPLKKMVDDCVIRALATVMGKSWDDVASELFIEQLNQKDLQNANSVWSVVLEKNGFVKKNLPCTYSSCYTVRQGVIDIPQNFRDDIDYLKKEVRRLNNLINKNKPKES